MGKQNLITIAIPTYKRPKYLRQAIESAINQIDPGLSYNIIVVNNDPETDITEIQNDYKESPVDIRFFTNGRNLGMLGNVNRCVELSEGEWVSFLHDDDLLLPNYINEISKYLNDPSISCLIPRRYLLFDGDGRAYLEKKQKKKHMLMDCFPGRLFCNNVVYNINPEDNVFSWQNCYGAPSCGVLFRKKDINRCGLFFPEGTYSWDFYSFLKLNSENNIKILQTVLSVYRMSTGLSLRPEVQLDFYKSFEQIKKSMSELNSECKSFIRRYDKEISYLNTCIMEENGKKLAREAGYKLVEVKPSHVKYYLFMFRRLCYFANHHLDVEVPLTKKGRIALIKMGVINK